MDSKQNMFFFILPLLASNGVKGCIFAPPPRPPATPPPAPATTTITPAPETTTAAAPTTGSGPEECVCDDEGGARLSEVGQAAHVNEHLKRAEKFWLAY